MAILLENQEKDTKVLVANGREVTLGSTMDNGIINRVQPSIEVDSSFLKALKKEPYFTFCVESGKIRVLELAR